MYQFVEEVKSRVMLENLPAMVTRCTKHCVSTYDTMYLKGNEEECVKTCYQKSFEF